MPKAGTGTGTKGSAGTRGTAGTRTGTEPSAGPLETCALLTMEPNALMAPIHSRMPLIIAPGDYAEWLDPETPASRVRALVAPWEPTAWTAYRVSLRVNAVANDDAGCVAPLGAA